MTLIEVLVVIGVLAILFAMMFPATPHPDKSILTRCISQLRQIDVAFLMYSYDNKGKFPMQPSITNDGCQKFPSPSQTFPYYQKLSEYLHSPMVLVCPTDKARRSVENFHDLTDINLSYFLNADVSTNQSAASILAGDRNLQVSGQAVPPGMFTLSTNQNMGWTRELHPSLGVLAFADGHVESCRTTNLNLTVKRQNIAASRLSIP